MEYSSEHQRALVLLIQRVCVFCVPIFTCVSCLGFCLVGDKKHTHVNTHVNIGTQNTHTRWISRTRARWCSDEYSMYHTGMQQPNEETYPGPLLVNIDRPYPHRE